MAYYADLSPYTYTPGHGPMLNVGWLAAGKAYERGPVPYEFATALHRLAQSPVNLCRGFHVCDLCTPPSTEYYNVWSTLRRGSGEVRVSSASGVVYAAPTLVWHYVAEHQYLPPREFINAVLAQPLSGAPTHPI